jgi:D-alanyl-lipoteichoic acid acyltransferase DltB (MBOAT superfamily)
MLSVTTAIFLSLLGSALFHLIPESKLRLRMGWVVILSFIIVFAHYPVAAVCAAGAGVFTWLLAILGLRYKMLQKYGPFSLIGILILFGYEDFFVDTDIFSKTLLQFGMSFYIFRLYLALRTSAARQQAVSLEEFLVIALFFPIFSAGPICAQEAFTRSSFLNRPLLHNYLQGFLRIGIGIFALYFATDLITTLTEPLLLSMENLTDWQGMTPLATYFVMVLNFMYLYANFAGYTEIAIGLGLFFGFQIPENFRYPFLATNIQNFWQRWHLSLSKFITTQIYLPLMLTLRKPRLCMFLAFVLVGMWHQVSIQYLVWGVGHGSMLVIYTSFSGSSIYAATAAKITPWVLKSLSWLLTMSLVSFFSTFANQPTLTQSLAFTQSLVTGW